VRVAPTLPAMTHGARLEAEDATMARYVVLVFSALAVASVCERVQVEASVLINLPVPVTSSCNQVAPFLLDADGCRWTIGGVLGDADLAVAASSSSSVQDAPSAIGTLPAG